MPHVGVGSDVLEPEPPLLTDGAELVADRCRVDVERVSELDDIVVVARGEPFGSRADRP